LNVGSSTGVIENFVNIDNSPFLWLADFAPWIRPLLSEKHRAALDEFQDAKQRARIVRRDCRRPLPYASGEVDHVLCSHFLEYLSPPEVRNILAEFHRVLRRDGTVHIILPDLSRMARRYVSGEIDANQFQHEMSFHADSGDTFVARLFQLWRGFSLTHLWMYDRATMERHLEHARLTVMDAIETPSSMVRADDIESVHIVAMKRAG
jgi:predicted SAM-dependent methyltransferase